MVKNKFIYVALIFILIISTSSFTFSQSILFSDYEDSNYEDSNQKTDREMKGIWVATLFNLDYPSKATTNPEILKSETITILDNIQDAGLNTIFLQIRPSSDAFYKSDFFPWSKYLTGSQGTPPDSNFDPLKFWIDEAHKRNIELHGWLNPYRITKKTKKEANFDTSGLYFSNPALLHPEWVVKHSDGNLYYNPGLPEVRNFIIESTIEIIDNYDIDGIHFDDYFYPGRTFEDEETYKKYGSDFFTIENWRRNNVNILISSLYKSIKEKDASVSFGISPFGIWANKSSNYLGSNTRGSQSFYDHFADSKSWIRDGSIDYIAPQLYWNIGFEIADYETLAYWWSDAVKNSNVKLYIGHAIYRAGNSDENSPWYGNDEIKKQLALNDGINGVSGSIFYRYKFLLNNNMSELLKNR